MSIGSGAHSAILDASTPAALSHWDELLDLQVDLFFPHELDFLHSFVPWLGAATALDVGCGNGRYLARLRSFFPDKICTGIDVSPQLVDLAIRQHSQPGLSFAAADFFTYEAPCTYDIILMRFIVQHLTDFEAILEQASRLASPGGGLLVVEPDPARSANSPPTPTFERMLRGFESNGARDGRLRARLSDVPALTEAVADWYVAEDRHITVPSIGPFAGTKTLRMYHRWIDVCERSDLFSFPFDEARREVDAWAAQPATFSRIALRLLYLQRGAPSADQDVSWREA